MFKSIALIATVQLLFICTLSVHITSQYNENQLSAQIDTFSQASLPSQPIQSQVIVPAKMSKPNILTQIYNLFDSDSEDSDESDTDTEESDSSDSQDDEEQVKKDKKEREKKLDKDKKNKDSEKSAI